MTRDLAERELRFNLDEREVVADPLGTYFGARVDRDELLPGADATIVATRFHDWRVEFPLAGWPVSPGHAAEVGA